MSVVKSINRSDVNRIATSCIGSLVAVTPDGIALVDFPGNAHGPQPARSIVRVNTAMLETLPLKVLLVFENNDPALPVITGLVQDRILAPAGDNGETALHAELDHGVIDGKILQVRAREEIVLQCGKSSIVLNKAGKIVIKGVQILSRALNSNKIKGGSVNIN